MAQDDNNIPRLSRRGFIRDMALTGFGAGALVGAYKGVKTVIHTKDDPNHTTLQAANVKTAMVLESASVGALVGGVALGAMGMAGALLPAEDEHKKEQNR